MLVRASKQFRGMMPSIQETLEVMVFMPQIFDAGLEKVILRTFEMQCRPLCRMLMSVS